MSYVAENTALQLENFSRCWFWESYRTQQNMWKICWDFSVKSGSIYTNHKTL